jgi:hypothetical protein
MQRRAEIERLLRCELDRSRLEYEDAKSEISSGFPHAAGVAGIQRAYSMALREFNEFVMDGKIPSRLDIH